MIKNIINWTNENSGFLSLLTFVATLFLGWISGLFNSLIKKPKLKVRFIDKVKFASFYYTGNKYINPDTEEEFNLHKTGFAVYMSIHNIGNMTTSIDKIFLGYYKNTTKNNFFKKNIIWLPQWNPGTAFRINFNNDLGIELQSLRIKNHPLDHSNKDRIDVGDSIIGVAYFEQEQAWGNLNPKRNEEGNIDVIIKIRDIYDKFYSFKTTLTLLPLEKAREFNQYFGNVESAIADSVE